MAKRKLNSKKIVRYCSKCGTRIIPQLVGAEEFYFETETGRIYPYSAFDRKTGKRQYVFRFRCPNKRWWNAHDDYMEGEIISTGQKTQNSKNEAQRDSLITVFFRTRSEWKKGYTWRARLSLRIFSWLFPGILKIKKER